MANQYKLKKAYPGSAPVNSIFELINGRYFTISHGEIFTANLDALKMTEYFEKLEVCPMIGKLIRKVETSLRRGEKQNKTVYLVNGWTSPTTTYLALTSINNTKETSSVQKDSKSWIEVSQYWFIDSKGKLQSDFHTSGELLNQNEHSYRKSIGNFFQTKIEASVATIKVTP
jgi:hypothetical protein